MQNINPPTQPNDPGRTRRLNPEELPSQSPDPARTRRLDPNESGTMLPGSQGRSNRPSPPPLYPDPYTQPLPDSVDALDVNATRVTPAAYNRGNLPTTPPPPQQPVADEFSWRRAMGCLVKTFVLLLFVFVVVFILGAIAAVIGYTSIAADLPSVEDLRNRTSQFETTRILDRSGKVVLYEILDPNAGRRTYVPITKISPNVVAATIATEDKDFYNHPGFDIVAIIRALWQNLTSGETVSGASTITQQLARNLLLSPEERYSRSYTRKIREVILAAEINRRYSKDEILELYLNENNYGNLAYGIEAAAETYFNTTADQLTLAQASFLAGLPQSPAVYDIHNNRDTTIKRHKDVLVLMYNLSIESNCIEAGNSPQPVCVGLDEALAAAQEIEQYHFPAPNVRMRYPHWVQFVRQQLESQFDAQTIYRTGFVVTTTLDAPLQDAAQQTVAAQVASLAGNNATNGALVAIRPQTGEILAMVGSPDFYNEAIDGQVNMATTQTRQPGSAIKPLTFLAAFEKGWTPSTLIWDVPSYFSPSGQPNDPAPPYEPVNYDGRFHGPVTLRTALANSYNIPAVKTLEFVGIYDDPNTQTSEGLIGMAQRLGITSLTRNDYGLALTLGGGEISLLELTGAYAVMANGGKRVPPVAILKITDYEGNVIYEYKAPEPVQAIRPEHAYLISSIMSDNEARSPMFGYNSVLNLPFAAAAKTGTTNDFRDNWTMGFSPDLATGVWVGNADYTPMQNTTGLSGAAPIWSSFMQVAVPYVTNQNPPTSFQRPPGMVDRVICSISGAEPSEFCKQGQRTEVFAADQLPLPASEDLWKKEVFDTWSGQRATQACKDFVKEAVVANVKDRFARQWLRKNDAGKNWAESVGFENPVPFVPDGDCDPNNLPVLEFVGLKDGDVLRDDKFQLTILAHGPGFESVQLEFADISNPDQWRKLFQRDNPVRGQQKVYTWDLQKQGNGRLVLRLRMVNKDGGYAERLIGLKIDVEEPTPTDEPATDTPTEEPTERPTRIPTHTPVIPTDVPTDVPTDIPTDVPTEIPTEAPTSTPEPPTPIPPDPTQTPSS